MLTQDFGPEARKGGGTSTIAQGWLALPGICMALALTLAGCASAPPARAPEPSPVKKIEPPVVQAPKPVEEPQVIPLGEMRMGRPERLPERLPMPQPLPPPTEGISTLPGIQEPRLPSPPVESAPTLPPPISMPSVAAPTNPVVVSMLTAADQYQNQGDLERASSSIERGLRVAPHDAHLWQRLSRIRLQQGRYQQAEEMAKKSNSFARGEKGMIVQNWLLIAEARQKMGDTTGAFDARQRASSLSGGH